MLVIIVVHIFLLQNARPKAVYFGVTDIAEEGVFRSIIDNSLNNYTNWNGTTSSTLTLFCITIGTIWVIIYNYYNKAPDLNQKGEGEVHIEPPPTTK